MTDEGGEAPGDSSTPMASPDGGRRRGVPGWVFAVIIALVVGAAVAVVVQDRTSDSTPATTAPTPVSVAATPSLPPVAGPFAAGRTPLPGFGETALVVRPADGGEESYCVLLARTAAQRARGLMEVRDASLGGYDGMAFQFPADTSGAFWMKDTPQALSIGFFDRDGALVSTADMAPCGSSDGCPEYKAKEPYRLALEVPEGRLGALGVGEGATVRLGGACRPAT